MNERTADDEAKGSKRLLCLRSQSNECGTGADSLQFGREHNQHSISSDLTFLSHGGRERGGRRMRTSTASIFSISLLGQSFGCLRMFINICIHFESRILIRGVSVFFSV